MDHCACACGCGRELDGPGCVCQVCRDGCCPAERLTDNQMFPLDQAIERTKTKLPEHWAAVVARTGRGSFWALSPEMVEKYIRGARPCEVPNPIPEVKYLRITCPFGKVIGFEDIEILDAFSKGVFVRMGAHGLELCILSDAESVPVKFGHVIVGPDDDGSGDMVVWTAFPGRLPPNKADEALLKAVWDRVPPPPNPAPDHAGEKVWLFPDDLRKFIGCAAKRVR